ncbi:MAG: hypothetical protein AAF985_25640, partial [Bacteroidota bacterium]
MAFLASPRVKKSASKTRVQLTVVIDFLPNDGSYRDVKQMGRLDTEYLPKKNWTRVLLADFFTLG